MICRKVKGVKRDLTILFMRGNFMRVLRMVMEHINFLMAHHIKDTSKIIYLTEMVHLNGQTENIMKEAGNKIKCMGMVLLHGRMGEHIKDNLSAM